MQIDYLQYWSYRRSWKYAALINNKELVTQGTSGLMLVLEYSGTTR